ncbi:MAG: 30S ribosome-binding factor RbfA [Chlamydiales bacterium]
MPKKRVDRLNSLLQEVLSDVIRKDVRDPRVAAIVSITRVSITADLQHAKVFISVIGTPKQKEDTVAALQSAAGFIAMTASKQVVMRYFPELSFKLDDTVEEQMRIDALLHKIHEEKKARQHDDEHE